MHIASWQFASIGGRRRDQRDPICRPDGVNPAPLGAHRLATDESCWAVAAPMRTGSGHVGGPHGPGLWLSRCELGMLTCDAIPENM